MTAADTVLRHDDAPYPDAFTRAEVGWTPHLAPLAEEDLTPRHLDGLVDAARAKNEYFRLLARDPEVLRARTLVDKDIFYNTAEGLPRAERKTRTDELLERVGLTEAADRKVGGYSGGMKRRLDLALSVLGDPELVFLDEPTTGFDPIARRDFWSLIRDLKHQGTTVLLTTHDMGEAEALADRIALLVDGSLVAHGTAEEIVAMSNATSADAALSSTLDEAYTRLVEEARRAHMPAAWSVSLGFDLERRALAITAAVRAGRLPQEELLALPAPDRGDALLLPVSSANTDNARQRLRELAEKLRNPAERPSAAQLDHERTQALKAEAARLVAERQATSENFSGAA